MNNETFFQKHTRNQSLLGGITIMTMTKKEAQVRIEYYLKAHNIRHTKDVDSGTPRINIIYTKCARCPDRMLEGCIWFYKNAMEVRTYFNQNAAEWCRTSSYIPELMRLLNFINARVWPSTTDGMGNVLYLPSCLYTSRIYLTEDDDYDITLTSIIPYDFYVLAPVETEDYITACCPTLLDELGPAIFGVLLGRLDVVQAIQYVRKNILYDAE